MKFSEMINQRLVNNDTLLCVGLDPMPNRFPTGFKKNAEGIFDFCKEIVDATADLVCAFKPQIAYFACNNAENELQKLIAWIHDKHPGIPVILDAKRGDIGSTAQAYAKEAFVRFEADCVTLSPYMGRDSVEPYAAYDQKGAFILCRTSNPGGDDIQMLDCGGTPLYQHVAQLVQGWNTSGEFGLVVGATYPDELAAVRKIAPEMNFLVPGIGAQGGDINAAVQAGLRPDGGGMIINSSRAVLYADSDPKTFAKAARQAAQDTKDKINEAKAAIPT